MKKGHAWGWGVAAVAALAYAWRSHNRSGLSTDEYAAASKALKSQGLIPSVNVPMTKEGDPAINPDWGKYGFGVETTMTQDQIDRAHKLLDPIIGAGRVDGIIASGQHIDFIPSGVVT